MHPQPPVAMEHFFVTMVGVSSLLTAVMGFNTVPMAVMKLVSCTMFCAMPPCSTAPLF